MARGTPLISARAMSFIYKFPAIIKMVPPIPIPYQSTSEAEGEQNLLFDVNDGTKRWQHYSVPNVPSMLLSSIVSMQFKTTMTIVCNHTFFQIWIRSKPVTTV
jgi:hypothetical protein